MKTKGNITVTDIRYEFVRLLTEDSKYQDHRKNDYNQAIFINEGNLKGYPIFCVTTLSMVMNKFDRAVKNLELKCHP